MDTVKNKRFRMLKSMNPWHFLWISVILSELFALASSTIQGYLRWGHVTYDLLSIVAIDALVCLGGRYPDSHLFFYQK